MCSALAIGFQCAVTGVKLLANAAALLSLNKAAALVGSLRLARWNGDGLARLIHCHHGEEAAIGMTHRPLADVLGHHLDTDFH